MGPVVARAVYEFLGVTREFLITKHRTNHRQATKAKPVLNLPPDPFPSRGIAAERAVLSPHWNITQSAAASFNGGYRDDLPAAMRDVLAHVTELHGDRVLVRGRYARVQAHAQPPPPLAKTLASRGSSISVYCEYRDDAVVIAVMHGRRRPRYWNRRRVEP